MEILDSVRVVFEKSSRSSDGPFYALATSPRDLAQWDSVAHVNIILEIEKEFEIEFSPRYMAELTNVGAICDAVRAANYDVFLGTLD